MTDRDRNQDGRIGLVERTQAGFEEGGLLGGAAGALGGFLQMTTPQPGFEGLGQTFNDFLEYTPVGDVRDFMAGIDEDSGLDWAERALAVFGGAGVATAGAAVLNQHTRLSRMRNEIRQMNQATASALTPLEGQGLADIARGPRIDDIEVPDRDLDRIGVSDYDQARTAQKFERDAASRAFRSFQLFDATTFDQLADGMLVDVNNNRPSASVPRTIEGARRVEFRKRLRVVGDTLVEQLGKEAFGDVDPATGQELSLDDRSLIAAQFAAVTWTRALDEGVLQIEGTNSPHLETFKALAGEMDPVRAAQYMDAMVQLTSQVLNLGIGPNLAVDPQSRIAKVVYEDGNLTTAVGVRAELLPTENLVNGTTGVPLAGKESLAALEGRLEHVDFQSLVGEFATNLMFEYLSAQAADPVRFQESVTWYRRANKTAEHLAGLVNRPVSQVGAVFSALSPQTAWTPDNLVAAIHTTLRYSMPDLDPYSAEYRQMFRETIEAGDWGPDLLRNSPKKWTMNDASGSRVVHKKGKGTTVDQAIEFYSDPQALNNTTGSWGPLAEGKKAVDVSALLLLNIPWQGLLSMSKTHTFAYLFTNPLAHDLAVIDTHSDRAALGFTKYTSEALSMKGVRQLPEGGFEMPTGERITDELATETLRLFEEQGFSEEFVLDQVNPRRKEDGTMTRGRVTTVAKYLASMGKIPSEQAFRRYDAQQLAHALVADMMGVDANQVQSSTWVPWQERKRVITQLLKGGDSARARGWRMAMQYRSVLDHLLGNPLNKPTVVAKISAATSDLNDIPRSAIEGSPDPIVVAGLRNGQQLVFADLDVPGVADVTRHLAPVPALEVDGKTPMVPRRPIVVEQLPAIEESLLANEEIAGELRSYVGGPETVPGLHAGNVMVVEFDSYDAANSFQRSMSEIPDAFGTRIQPSVSVRRNQGGSQVFGRFDESSLERTRWAALEAHTSDIDLDAHRELLIRLRRKYGKDRVFEAEGGYEGDGMGPRPSIVVTGAPVSEIAAIAAEYGQQSIATNTGLVFTDQAGGFVPWEGDVTVGPDAATKPGRTQVGDFMYAYDIAPQYYDAFDNPDLREPATGQDLRAGDQRASYQVVVDLGGVKHGVKPESIQDVWDLARKSKAQSRSLYAHGELWVPQDAISAVEHVYTDGARTVAWRTRTDTSPADRHRVKVYVDPESAQGLGAEKTNPAASNRTFDQVEALTVEQPELNRIVVGGDIAVLFPDGARVQRWRGQPLASKVDGESARSAVLDLTGQIPVIHWGQSAEVAGPGLVHLDVTNGKVKRMRAFDQNDLVAAHEALGRLGVEPSRWDLETEQEVEYTRQRSIDQAIIGEVKPFWRTKASPETNQLSRAIQGRISERAGYQIPLELTDNVSPAQALRMEEILSGFLGGDGPDVVKRFVAEHGVANFKDALREGISVATIIETGGAKGLQATTAFSKTKVPGIIMNERLFARARRVGADMARKNEGWLAGGTNDIVDRIFIHELGHAVHSQLDANGYNQMIWGKLNDYSRQLTPLGQKNAVSGYSLDNTGEFFAEIFTKVVYNENVTQFERDLINQAMQLARGVA